MVIESEKVDRVYLKLVHLGEEGYKKFLSCLRDSYANQHAGHIKLYMKHYQHHSNKCYMMCCYCVMQCITGAILVGSYVELLTHMQCPSSFLTQLAIYTELISCIHYN